MNTIVLVEDDIELSSMIIDFLEIEGFDVVGSDNGIDAVETILTINPDLVILDIMLPGIDGMEVCRQIRRQFSNPILMLTAKDDDFVEVASLELGADNYLTKPIRPHVLLAHIKALLRRESQHGSGKSNRLTVQDIALDDKTYQVFQDEQLVNLTTGEFELLQILMKNAGTPISRDDLYAELRGVEYDGLDRSIDLRISAVRKKLNDEVPPYRYIKTIRNKGYLFASH